MIDDLLKESEVKYRQARQYLAAGANERALIDYHEALEKILRWGLVRDGADYARASDPDQVSWQDLITYLDVRYAVPRQLCAFLSQMTYLYKQAAEGRHPALPALTMQSYEQLVAQLFRRFYPRSPEEREQVAMRGTFGRRQPPGDLTAWPPDRLNDTRVMVPTPPPPDEPPAVGQAPAARQADPAAPVRLDQMPRPGAAPVKPATAAPAPPTAVSPAPAPPAAPAENTPGSARSLASGPGASEDRYGSRPAPPPPAAGDGTITGAAVPPPVGHWEAQDADIQRQRAIAAGQRLREMRLSGQDFCPRCREPIALTSASCPQCNFDLDEYRAQRAARRTSQNGILDRFLGRRRPPP